MTIRAAETANVKPPLQPSFPLDVVGQNFLQAGAGAELTALQRAMFLDLTETPGRLEEYARTGATNAELAIMFYLPVEAIDLFEPLLLRSRVFLNDRIREAYLKAADKGEPTALAYLSNRYLESREPSPQPIGRNESHPLRRFWKFFTLSLTGVSK